jgi:Glutathione S-transferase, N-terminal domain
MALKLYFHPLASFCHKALIALYENGIAFERIIVDLRDEASRAAFRAVWPMAKMPVLRDEARNRTVAESTIIIEFLHTHCPGPTRFLPADVDRALSNLERRDSSVGFEANRHRLHFLRLNGCRCFLRFPEPRFRLFPVFCLCSANGRLTHGKRPINRAIAPNVIRDRMQNRDGLGMLIVAPINLCPRTRESHVFTKRCDGLVNGSVGSNLFVEIFVEHHRLGCEALDGKVPLPPSLGLPRHPLVSLGGFGRVQLATLFLLNPCWIHQKRIVGGHAIKVLKPNVALSLLKPIQSAHDFLQPPDSAHVRHADAKHRAVERS